MTAHRALPLLLALALLLAQQAGLAHALSHLDPHTPSKSGLSHTTLCEKCSTFGQLSSAVPTSATIVLDQSSPASHVSICDSGIVRRTVAVFRSRAPPHLG
jgi:hypothetical protein